MSKLKICHPKFWFLMNEFKLIEQIQAKYGLVPADMVGIGDDCAVLPHNEDEVTLVSTDMLVQDVHFALDEMTFEQIGYKAAAVNVSDIAAMGGVPEAMLISLGLPKGLTEQQVLQMYEGIKTLNQCWNIAIIGGDTVASDRLILSVTILAKAAKGKVVYRSGVQDGDWICVTGSLGGSRASKHYSFVPCINEAQWLVQHCRPSSMIDISDGLVGDLRHLMTASQQKGAWLDPNQIPVSKICSSLSSEDALKAALSDGEDFELLVTLSDDQHSLLDAAPFKISLIGRIDSSYPDLTWKDGSDIQQIGFQHF